MKTVKETASLSSLSVTHKQKGSISAIRSVTSLDSSNNNQDSHMTYHDINFHKLKKKTFQKCFEFNVGRSVF